MGGTDYRRRRRLGVSSHWGALLWSGFFRNARLGPGAEPWEWLSSKKPLG